jgi:hypothetical protein
MPAVIATLAVVATAPLAFLSTKLMLPSAAKPSVSLPDMPVLVIEGTDVVNKSLRPKNCEKPVPAREDGLVLEGSPTTTPKLPPSSDSTPSVKSAEPPTLESALFSLFVRSPTSSKKLAG